MGRFARNVLGILLALLFTVTVHAETPLSAVGEVLRVTNAAAGGLFLQRSPAAERPSFASELLYPGDSLRVVGGTQADIRDVVAGQTIHLTAAGGTVRLTGVRAPKWTSGGAAYLSAFSALFSKPAPPIVTYTLTRGGVASIRAPAFLPPSRQIMPPGAGDAPLLWFDGAAEVKATSASGETASVPVSRTTNAVVHLSTSPTSVVVTGLDGTRLTWIIETGTSPPNPPWRRDYPGVEETGDRLAAAAWILQAGPQDWRVFALSELLNLSAVDPAADRLWRGVRSGEWPVGRP